MNQIERSKRYQTEETMGRFEKYGSGEMGDLFLKNISTSGACFKLLTRRVSLQAGDLMRVKVALGEMKKERVVNAEIIWTDGDNVGVKFIRPDEVWQRLVEKKF